MKVFWGGQQFKRAGAEGRYRVKADRQHTVWDGLGEETAGPTGCNKQGNLPKIERQIQKQRHAHIT